MLIGMYWLLTKVFLPQIAVYVAESFDAIMIFVIVIAGIVLLFGSVGVHISNNLGSTVVGSVFRTIGFVVRTLVQAIAWLIRQIVRLLPRVYRGSRNFYRNIGCRDFISVPCAVLTTLIALAIII